MTWGTRYGFFYKGHYFLQDVWFHAESECPIANRPWAKKFVDDLITSVPLDQILEILDAILENPTFELPRRTRPYNVASYTYNNTGINQYDPTEFIEFLNQRHINTFGQPLNPQHIAVQSFQNLLKCGNIYKFNTISDTYDEVILQGDEFARRNDDFNYAVLQFIDLDRMKFVTIHNCEDIIDSYPYLDFIETAKTGETLISEDIEFSNGYVLK